MPVKPGKRADVQRVLEYLRAIVQLPGACRRGELSKSKHVSASITTRPTLSHRAANFKIKARQERMALPLVA